MISIFVNHVGNIEIYRIAYTRSHQSSSSSVLSPSASVSIKTGTGRPIMEKLGCGELRRRAKRVELIEAMDSADPTSPSLTLAPVF